MQDKYAMQIPRAAGLLAGAMTISGGLRGSK